MDPRRRSQSLHFTRDHFDNEGLLLIDDGIINHNGNIRFASDLGDIQIQKIFSTGDVTAGPGTNLFLKENLESGGEVNVQGSLESEESVIVKYGIFIGGSLKAWEEIKASSISTKNLVSFGTVFSKYEIIVDGYLKVHRISCGSNISIKGKSFIDGDLRTMGSFKPKSHVKCYGKISARELFAKGNVFAKLGVEILEKVNVFGNFKVSGDIKIPVKLYVRGDLEYIGYLQCPLVIVDGDIYLVQS